MAPKEKSVAAINQSDRVHHKVLLQCSLFCSISQRVSEVSSAVEPHHHNHHNHNDYMQRTQCVNDKTIFGQTLKWWRGEVLGQKSSSSVNKKEEYFLPSNNDSLRLPPGPIKFNHRTLWSCDLCYYCLSSHQDKKIYTSDYLETKL